VLFLSAIIAVYVVINGLVQYVFDAAALENAVEEIRSVTNFKGGPTLAVLLMQAIPGVTTSIAFSLLVPFCGWLGTRQNNQQLMGCFCGCNFLHCCCSLAGLVGMIIFTIMLSTAAPGIEDYLELCDPVKCSLNLEQYPEQEQQERVVDCFAAGFWDDYEQKFVGNHQYPEICPKLVLRCNSFAPPDSDETKFRDWFKDETVSDVAPGVSGAFAGYETPGMEIRGPEAWSEDPDFGAPPRTGLRRLVSRQVPLPAVEGGSESLPRWDQAAEPENYFPMPSDPIDDCEPQEKAIKFIHKARILLPELLPKLMIFISIKLLLLVPAILLGCLGFWWGKDLFLRYSEGYGRLGAPPAAQPRVLMQQQPIAITGSIPLPQAYAVPMMAARMPEASAPIQSAELRELTEARDAQE